jgi:hypothetical protein
MSASGAAAAFVLVNLLSGNLVAMPVAGACVVARALSDTQGEAMCGGGIRGPGRVLVSATTRGRPDMRARATCPLAVEVT